MGARGEPTSNARGRSIRRAPSPKSSPSVFPLSLGFWSCPPVLDVSLRVWSWDLVLAFGLDPAISARRRELRLTGEPLCLRQVSSRFVLDILGAFGDIRRLSSQVSKSVRRRCNLHRVPTHAAGGRTHALLPRRPSHPSGALRLDPARRSAGASDSPHAPHRRRQGVRRKHGLLLSRDRGRRRPSRLLAQRRCAGLRVGARARSHRVPGFRRQRHVPKPRQYRGQSGGCLAVHKDGRGAEAPAHQRPCERQFRRPADRGDAGRPSDRARHAGTCVPELPLAHIHDIEHAKASSYTPQAGQRPLEPAWKSFDAFKNVVPPRKR